MTRDGILIAFPGGAADWASVISKIPYPSIEFSPDGTILAGLVISKYKRQEELEPLRGAALNRGLMLEREIRLLRNEVESLRTELDRLTTSLEGLSSHTPYRAGCESPAGRAPAATRTRHGPQQAVHPGHLR